MDEPTDTLNGKVALITGASKRVGAETARVLHAAGMNLALHYRSSEDEANRLRAELESARAESVQLLQADLRETGRLHEVVEKVTGHWGRLDLLVNNASAFYPTAVGEIDENHWHELIDTNLKAPLFLSQAAAKPLSAARGCIINLIDIHAERPMRRHVVYSISKAGLLAMTKSLARELAPEVRVNGVAPGVAEWPEEDENTERQNSILARVALGRAGTPEDIARTILFLFRDAPYVTGHMLPVDGGRLLYI